MAGRTVCPRCGARDSFMTGYLPETCVCQRCMSQLDWREIPGCGPDCNPVEPEAAPEPPAPIYVAAAAAPNGGAGEGDAGDEGTKPAGEAPGEDPAACRPEDGER